MLTAESSAFEPQSGEYYDEDLPDLIDYASGDSPYLSDTAGLFQETVYYIDLDGSTKTANGVMPIKGPWPTAKTAARLAPGSAGGPILVASYTYDAAQSAT